MSSVYNITSDLQVINFTRVEYLGYRTVDMEVNMKDQLQQVIEIMRSHVLNNLDLIKTNESHIREVLNWPQSSERTNELNDSYKYSKNLLSENNDFINLQVSIMNLLNKYKYIFETEATVKVSAPSNTMYGQALSRDDYFKLTIENDMAFDSDHPYFQDHEFYSDLLLYFEQVENYEMCAELMKSKKN